MKQRKKVFLEGESPTLTESGIPPLHTHSVDEMWMILLTHFFPQFIIIIIYYFFIFSWQFTKSYIYTVKIAQYWLIKVNYLNYKVKNNWEKYTDKLINIKMKVKTTPTTQSWLVGCRVCKAYKGIHQVSNFLLPSWILEGFQVT